MDEEQRSLLARYVEAFERYDLDSLVSLLHDDVVQWMPPYELWLQGPAQVRSWFLGAGIGCRDSVVVPVEPANGMPAFGQYKPGEEGGYVPWSIHVLEIRRHSNHPCPRPLARRRARAATVPRSGSLTSLTSHTSSRRSSSRCNLLWCSLTETRSSGPSNRSARRFGLLAAGIGSPDPCRFPTGVPI